MKREEILKQTIESFDEGDRYVVDKNDVKYIRQDIVLKAMELSEHPLPPAEGAEEIGVYDIANKWAVWAKGNEVAARDSMVADLYGLLNAHAQRIAEKMVSERLRAMTERCKKLEFMIENGLGWEDMRNDITMPHEI